MIDSQDKPSPDSPGRWWVTRKDGYSLGVVMKRDADGELHGFEVCEGDQWQNIDALEAERDAARQEAKEWEACAIEHSNKLGDLCNAVHTRCDELGVVPGDVIERVQRLANSLASLRAKGETDTNLCEYDQLIRDFTRTMIRRWDAAGNFLEDAQALYRMREGVAAAVTEASRAT